MLAVRTKLVAGCIIVFLIVSCETALPSSGGDRESPDPTLPRVILDTRYTAPTGATIIVSAGGGLPGPRHKPQPERRPPPPPPPAPRPWCGRGPPSGPHQTPRGLTAAPRRNNDRGAGRRGVAGIEN